MRTLILFNLFALISIIESSSNSRDHSQTTARNKGKSTVQALGSAKIPEDKVAPGFMKLLQSMSAAEIKLKYELGQQLTMIMQAMDKSNPQPQSQAITSEELNVLEDNKAAWAVYDAYRSGGWGRIKDLLGYKDDKIQVKNKLMGIAIRHENPKLIRDLINNRAIFISYDMYQFAIRNAMTLQTDSSERIVDIIANAAKVELGIVPNYSKKLELGLASLKIYDYINDHEFPMLNRALREGLNPNMRIPNVGSLLGISSMVKCHRCVKLLIDFGADVNVPLEYTQPIEAKALNEDIIPKDWSPLMIAVAHGQERMIELLIKSGARVTYIPPGREEDRFHARAVARKIEDKEERAKILPLLKLNTTEKEEVNRAIEGKSFLQAVLESNPAIIDRFLMLNHNLDTLQNEISTVTEPISEVIANLLVLEGVISS